jgi:hypothetical protein
MRAPAEVGDAAPRPVVVIVDREYDLELWIHFLTTMLVVT